jgi:hypothetical protein
MAQADSGNFQAMSEEPNIADSIKKNPKKNPKKGNKTRSNNSFNVGNIPLMIRSILNYRKNLLFNCFILIKILNLRNLG